MSHTPGPWEVVTSTRSASTVRSNDGPIAEMWIGSIGNHKDNAALIAAAPDLLAALKALAELAHNSMDVPDYVWSVIAKAEGK